MQGGRGITRITEVIEVDGEDVEVDLVHGDLWAIEEVRIVGERPIRPSDRSHPTKQEALEVARELALKMLRG